MKLKISLVAQILMLFFFSANATAFEVYPHTGQDKCYNDSSEITCPTSETHLYYGQDAQHVEAVRERSYTKLDANGNDLPLTASDWTMVRDNVTGLVWEIKDYSDGTANFINPHDPDNTYYWCDTNTSTNGGDEGVCTSTINTEDFIESLNNSHFGGFTGWRIPTIRELQSLYHSGVYPSISSIFRNWHTSQDYWSATNSYSLYSSSYAWTIEYTTGDRTRYKGLRYYTVAVRGIQTDLRNRFVDNFNGTVTDAVTGLLWQKETQDSYTTWQEALSYCKYSNLGGYLDWRTPDRNELLSLVDYDRSHPATNFPDTKIENRYYWSSTTDPNYSRNTMMVSFADGTDGSSSKSYTSSAVRCVRGTHHVPIFSITASAGTGGGIEPSGTIQVPQDENKTFNITPDSGLHIDRIVVDGVNKGSISSYTFYSVIANHSISATFKRAPKPDGSLFLLNYYLTTLSADDSNNTPLAGETCAVERVYDCSLNCVDELTALSWIGDGVCDVGQYGINLLCPAFQYDGGDCD